FSCSSPRCGRAAPGDLGGTPPCRPGTPPRVGAPGSMAARAAPGVLLALLLRPAAGARAGSDELSDLAASDSDLEMRSVRAALQDLQARVSELERAREDKACCAVWVGGKRSEPGSDVVDWCTTKKTCELNFGELVGKKMVSTVFSWVEEGEDTLVTDVVDIKDLEHCRKKRAGECPA
ncbi:unnamed protein product, partial [Prorocentrum cordatum]